MSPCDGDSSVLTFLIPCPAVSPAVLFISSVWRARAARRGQWFLTRTPRPHNLGRGAEMIIVTDLINDIFSFISLITDQPFFFMLGFHHCRVYRLLLLLLCHIDVDALCC